MQLLLTNAKATSGIKVSQDKSKVMAIYPSRNEENKDIFHVLMMDSALKKVWENTMLIPETNGSPFFLQSIVDNNGNFHILRNVAIEGDAQKHFELLSFYDEGKRPVVRNLTLKSKYITDGKLIVNSQGELICAGFYTENPQFGIYDGSYFIKYNEDTQALKKTTNEFSDNFKNQYIDASKIEKRQNKIDKGKFFEPLSQELADLQLKKDDGIILIGEKSNSFSTKPHALTFVEKVNSIFLYNFEDISIVSYDSNGEMIWQDKIPKKQKGEDKDCLSYAMVYKNENLYFLLNDDPENLNLRKSSSPERTDGLYANTILYKFDNKGDKASKKLYHTEDIDLRTRLSRCAPINDDKMLIFAKLKGKQKYGILPLQ